MATMSKREVRWLDPSASADQCFRLRMEKPGLFGVYAHADRRLIGVEFDTSGGNWTPEHIFRWMSMHHAYANSAFENVAAVVGIDENAAPAAGDKLMSELEKQIGQGLQTVPVAIPYGAHPSTGIVFGEDFHNSAGPQMIGAPVFGDAHAHQFTNALRLPTAFILSGENRPGEQRWVGTMGVLPSQAQLREALLASRVPGVGGRLRLFLSQEGTQLRTEKRGDALVAVESRLDGLAWTSAPVFRGAGPVFA
jgi:hypothetical protein